jgi:hypothetical protein
MITGNLEEGIAVARRKLLDSIPSTDEVVQGCFFALLVLNEQISDGSPNPQNIGLCHPGLVPWFFDCRREGPVQLVSLLD